MTLTNRSYNLKGELTLLHWVRYNVEINSFNMNSLESGVIIKIYNIEIPSKASLLKLMK